MSAAGDLYEELAGLVAALDSGSVEYALCGALALAVHGIPRATRDIDMLVRPEQKADAVAAARGVGFTLEALPMRFAATGVEVKRLTKIVDSWPLVLDFLFVNEALEGVWASREQRAWSKGRISVVSREGLVQLKLSAGRPQDLADIARLESLKEEK